MAWSTPKTDWATNDAIGFADLNRIEANTEDLDSRLGTLESEERGQFDITLTGFTGTHTVTIGYKKDRALYTGGPSIVTLSFPYTNKTDGNDVNFGATGVPVNLRPNSSNTHLPFIVREGGFNIGGLIALSSSGNITFYTLGVFPILGKLNTLTFLTNNTGQTPRGTLQVSAVTDFPETQQSFADVAESMNTERYIGPNDFKNGTGGAGQKGFAAQVISYPVYP